MDTGRVLIVGMPLNAARVFFYEFRGFVWPTADGAQHMEFDLANPAFEEELKAWSTRQATSSPYVFADGSLGVPDDPRPPSRGQFACCARATAAGLVFPVTGL